MPSYMMQLYVEQVVSAQVTNVYPLQGEAYLLLDPTKSTVVREIAVQKVGSILASNARGIEIGGATNAFATVKLQSRGGGEQELFAPSHVASPAITGVGMAVLRVIDYGASSTSGTLSCGRAAAGHAYLDQT